MFANADKDGNHRLDYDEFVDWICSAPGRVKIERTESGLLEVRAFAEERNVSMQVFTLSGQCYILQTSEHMPIEEVKQLLEKETEIPTAQQVLLLNDEHELNDSSKVGELLRPSGEESVKLQLLVRQQITAQWVLFDRHGVEHFRLSGGETHNYGCGDSEHDCSYSLTLRANNTFSYIRGAR